MESGDRQQRARSLRAQPCRPARDQRPARRRHEPVQRCRLCVVRVVSFDSVGMVLVEQAPSHHRCQRQVAQLRFSCGPGECPRRALGSVDANNDSCHPSASSGSLSIGRAGGAVPAGPTALCLGPSRCIVGSERRERRMGLPKLKRLVPIDLSDESERAIAPALRLAHRAEVPVVLFSWSFDEGEAAAAKRYLIDFATNLSETVSVEVAATTDRTAAPAIAAATTATPPRSAWLHMDEAAWVGRSWEASPRRRSEWCRRPSLLVGPRWMAPQVRRGVSSRASTGGRCRRLSYPSPALGPDS